MRLCSLLRWDVRLVLSVLALVSSACDEFPGIDAVGVQRGPRGEIEVVKPLCPGDRVTEVSLFRAPDGHLDESESGVLWQITSETGSTQDRYVVGTTPAGFVEEVHLSRVPREAEGLAATIDSAFDAQALMASCRVNSDRIEYWNRTDTSLLTSSRRVTEIVATTSPTNPGKGDLGSTKRSQRPVSAH
jgi:hypothetical protein